MQIIECDHVDLISPFPMAHVGRLRSWLYCYKTLVLDDSNTMNEQDTEEFLLAGIQNPSVVSWGVIDKNNLTNYHHPAPLVGFISFEFNGPYNGYFHVASPRTAWGKGLIDEAANTVIKHVFEASDVLRVSAAILDKNKPAKSLCYRLGFKRDGLFEDFVRQNGQPLAVVHFGLTRTKWDEMHQPSESTQEEEECQHSKTSGSPSPQWQFPLSQESEPLQDPSLEQPLEELVPVETKAE